MRRLLFVLALGVSTTAMLRSGIRQDVPLSANRDAGETTDGAFRDGLYLGRLAAQRGSEPHIASGRWATDRGRASFTEGYQQGYSESLAVQAAGASLTRGSE